MATYYVDPAATGANNGTSWANAWTTLQTAVDNWAAGDTIYCRGTETLAAAIDVDGTDGTNTSPVRIIGTNSSGTDDGTYFTLDGNSAAASCIAANACNYLIWKNVRFTAATSDGVQSSNGISNWWAFYNCRADNNGGNGINGTNRLLYTTLVRCMADNNTLRGAYMKFTNIVLCEFIGNSTEGVRVEIGALVGCVSHDNTTDNIVLDNSSAMAFACVADGSGADGIEAKGYPGTVIGCRLTNNAGNGLDRIRMLVEDYNFAYNNGTNLNGTPDLQGGNSDFAGAAHGYNDLANDDFTTTTSATLANNAVTVGSDQ